MDPTVVDTVQLGGAAAHDLSMWSLFWQADWIVKSVMLALIAASVVTWAIIFEKIGRLRSLNSRAADFEEAFWSGGSLEALYEKIGKRPADPMSAVFAAGMKEWKHATERGWVAQGAMRAGLQQRVERVMQVTMGREIGNLERYMTFLASVGSTAPFLGLFGTVWGIMNSFQAIAASKNTSLAVVAPGIAEALFATAIGLVAAIPAVIAYNKFNTDLSRYADRLDAFAGEFNAILSRHLEERA